MSRNLKLIAVGIVVLVVAGIGVFLYATRDLAAPTTDIEEAAEQLETSTEAAGSETVFRISQANSQVAFNIFEVLNGSDKTVVGTTDQVAGDVLVNLDDPAQSQIGEIRINARTFTTDDDRRDNAVGRFVLQSESDANEFIVFQPTAVTGWPETAAVGDTLTLAVTGDLTIAGTTNPVTFEVTATLESADTLTGHGEATIARADFGLTIPDVPFVANVGDTVTLIIDFTANAVAADA